MIEVATERIEHDRKELLISQINISGILGSESKLRVLNAYVRRTTLDLRSYIFDLTSLEGVNDAGLGFIWGLHLGLRNRIAYVLGENSKIRDLLEDLNYTRSLKVFSTVQEARAAILSTLNTQA